MHFPCTVQKHSSFAKLFRWARKQLNEAFKLCHIEMEKRKSLLVNQFFFILHLILSGAVLVVAGFSCTVATQ